VHHGGNIEGFSSLVSLMPDQNLGVVVLSNSLNLLGYVVSRNVYDRFLETAEADWNTPLRGLYAQVSAAFAQARVPPEVAGEVPEPSRESLAGEYRHPAFGTVRVVVEADALELEFASGLRSKLLFMGDSFWGTTSAFYLPQISVRFAALDAAGPTELRLSFGSGTGEVTFKRQSGAGVRR
jgi:hypothetical protein